MRAKTLEELQVYQRAVRVGDEIPAILRRPAFNRHLKLRGQLDDASQSVAALIAEGFPLKTDRHFADYLYRAKGSSSETRAHLHAARVRECITLDEEQRLRSEYIEIEKMLAGLISYLRGSDWMDRW